MMRRVAVLCAAAGMDLLWGDLPNRLHPVAFFGRGIARIEERLPAGSDPWRLASGAALATGGAAVAAVAAALAVRRARTMPGLVGLLLEALVVKQTFAVRGLFAHAGAVRKPLEAGDLEGARQAVSWMVSRETGALPAAGVASAAIESLSENASDSAVAPWLWYAAGGAPAAAAYRAINTLDAMVGYRSKGLLGMPSARVDDLLNWIPARATAAAFALASSAPAAAWRGAREDHRATPSPNSGWPMAAAAHALGVRLVKEGHHILNDGGPAPTAADIRRAEALTARALGIAAAGVAALALFLARPRG